MTIRVKGVNNIRKSLAANHRNLIRAFDAGIIDSTSYIERKSNKLAPKDTGFMRLSSFTTDVDRIGTTQIGRVGYDSNYAAYVHEMPESNNFTTPGTEPKFLEKAVKRNQNTIIRIFFMTVSRILKSWR